MKFTVMIALFLAMTMSAVSAEPPEGARRGTRASGQQPDKETICARRAERKAAHANREPGARGQHAAGGQGRRGGKGGRGGSGDTPGNGARDRQGSRVDCS